MNPCIDQLNAYLSEHSPDYGCYDLHSLLELLWYSYTQSNPIDNEAIRQNIDRLVPVMESLSLKYSDMLFDAISDLCLETEKKAFLEGIHVGVRLTAELSALPS